MLKCHNDITQINTFHENEAETRSPREATKFRASFGPRFEKAAVRQWLSHSVIHVARRGSYLDEQDFQSCVKL